MRSPVRQRIVMVLPGGGGGIRSVLNGYLADGLSARWTVTLLDSNAEGGFPLRFRQAARSLLRLLALLLRGRVDLVHCHSAMRRSFWRKSVFALVSRVAGVPVVFHIHGSEMKEFVRGQNPFMKLLIRMILEKQSAVLVLSESWSHFLKSISPSATIRILPNWVTPPSLSGEIRGSKEGPIELLFLGIVGERKGIYDLLPAFKTALLRIPHLRLVIAGNGDVDRARALSVELGIDRDVAFPGWVGGEEKVSLLRRADIYVLPSHNEGLPVSLLEAMSWQIPVISTRVGGIPDLVREGRDGFLIDPGDRAGLAVAMVDLAQNSGLRKRMGMEARRRIDHCFSRDVVMPRLENLYDCLIQGTTPGMDSQRPSGVWGRSDSYEARPLRKYP